MRIYARLLRATHHDLATFLEYAENVNLSKDSTVFVGTRYEYIVQRALLRFGFSLERIGGAGDLGIDLRGSWRPPSLQGRSLRVSAQCKWRKRLSGPYMVRELEGAFASTVSAWRSQEAPAANECEPPTQEDHGDAVKSVVAFDGTQSSDSGPVPRHASDALRMYGTDGEGTVTESMALLITPLKATKGMRDAMGRSRWPMAYAMINEDGWIQQFLWNRRSADNGLEGLQAETMYRSDLNESKSDEITKVTPEVILTWEGKTWSV